MPPAIWPVSSTASRTRLGNLLRLAEVILRRLGQRAALERHDALIALLRQRLVEGDGEIALAEQSGEVAMARKLAEPVGVEADIAPQLAAAIVADEQIDDPALGLRLDGELALGLLEHRAEQGGQHQRLGQDAGDRRRIIVRREDLVEQRPEPHQPAARVAAGNGEAERLVEIGGARLGLEIGGGHGGDVANARSRFKFFIPPRNAWGGYQAACGTSYCRAASERRSTNSVDMRFLDDQRRQHAHAHCRRRRR